MSDKQLMKINYQEELVKISRKQFALGPLAQFVFHGNIVQMGHDPF
jgi:hypothetical protein